MSRNLFLFVLMIIVAGSADYARADVTVMAGVTKYGQPADGLYWNENQPNDLFLTPAAVGIRWDSKRLPFNISVGVQYTHFGMAKTNALAVSKDAPEQGGYIPNSGGQCVGTCAPLHRWKMESEAQSVALIAVKHFGNFGLEAGLNLYETKTRGHVNYGTGVYTYPSGRNLATSPMFGVSYRKGPWSVRLQTWLMDGPAKYPDGKEEAPAVFNDTRTWTLLVGYTF